MGSIRTGVMLLLVLTLGLAASVAGQPLSGPEYIGIEPCRLADTRPGFGFPGEKPELRIIPESLWQAAHERITKTRTAYLRTTSGACGAVPRQGSSPLICSAAWR